MHCSVQVKAAITGNSTTFGRVDLRLAESTNLTGDSSASSALLFVPSAFATSDSSVSATLSASWVVSATVQCNASITPGLNYATSATFTCNSSVAAEFIFVPSATITCDSGITATAGVYPSAAHLYANSGTAAALLGQFAGDALLLGDSVVAPRLGVYPTLATLAGGSRVIAGATVLPIPLPPPPIKVGAAFVGRSTLSASPTVAPIPAPRATLLASSALAAQSRIAFSAASSLGGRASLVAFFGTPAAGLAVGTASVTARPIHLAAASGTSTCFSLVTASPIQVFINSARAAGTSTFTDLFIVDGLATASGIATVAFATPTVIRGASGRAAGVGLLQWNFPLPMRGSSNASAAPTVTQVLPVRGGHCEQCRRECPYSHLRHRRWEERHQHAEHGCDGRYEGGLFNPQPWMPHVHRPPRSFEYGHTLTKGDLQFFLKDRTGNPVSPFSVTYTLYRVHPGGSMQQVGPYDRTAARSGVGEYYVTGTAGENGQPGWWVVQWCYQQVFNGQAVLVDECFHVVDAATTHIANDNLCRVKKFGWD